MNIEKIKSEVIHRAVIARQKAYAPYSQYGVGAALLTESGKIFDGINIENAAYPLTICAERVAVFKAVSEGEKHFIGIAVCTRDGGSPCGSCRQVLAEFGLDILVWVVDSDGKQLYETTVRELLPRAFTPANLVQTN